MGASVGTSVNHCKKTGCGDLNFGLYYGSTTPGLPQTIDEKLDGFKPINCSVHTIEIGIEIVYC